MTVMRHSRDIPFTCEMRRPGDDRQTQKPGKTDIGVTLIGLFIRQAGRGCGYSLKCLGSFFDENAPIR